MKPYVIPDLAAALDQSAKDALARLNCHQVGTIQSFDATTNTATVSLEYSLSVNGVVQNSPVLVDVPVFILGGGNRVFTFPIRRGDSCLVLFNDRDMDNWHHTGSGGVPSSNRMHDLSDGLALVGFRSQANPVIGYSTTDVEMRNGVSRVAVGEKLLLQNASTDLKAVLQSIVTALTALNSVKTGGDASATISVVTQQINLLLKSS